MHKNQENGISEEILCAEYEAVYRYAMTLCKNPDEAADITQDTFLKAIKGKNDFRGESGLYTWLCSIAKNTWLNRCKKADRESLRTADGGERILPDDRKSIEEKAADHDSAMQIHRILHTLDEPYKEVFSLRVFGQLSFSDIARLFSRTDSWARVTYHRAKIAITEKLRKDGLL